MSSDFRHHLLFIIKYTSARRFALGCSERAVSAITGSYSECKAAAKWQLKAKLLNKVWYNETFRHLSVNMGHYLPNYIDQQNNYGPCYLIKKTPSLLEQLFRILQLRRLIQFMK